MTNPLPRTPIRHLGTLPMTVKEFCEVGDYTLSEAVRVRLGIRASQLYQQLFKRRPVRRGRDKLGVYTFGILNRALDDVMNGVEEDAERAEQPKRRRGRPRKVPAAK
jgi:hypothetical protein